MSNPNAQVDLESKTVESQNELLKVISKGSFGLKSVAAPVENLDAIRAAYLEEKNQK